MEIRFKNKHGESSARIDDLELRLSYNGRTGFYEADVFIYDRVKDFPCEYADCPIGRQSHDCDHYNDGWRRCPYLRIEERVVDYSGFVCSSPAELKGRLRDLFSGDAGMVPGKGVRNERAAKRFVKDVWNLDIG